MREGGTLMLVGHQHAITKKVEEVESHSRPAGLSVSAHAVHLARDMCVFATGYSSGPPRLAVLIRLP